MVKQVPSDNFRAVRRVLEPEDFAAGPDTPDPPPSDLVDEATWQGIVGLPEDVSIRTSDHHGSELSELFQLRGAWSEAIGSSRDQLWETMLDAIFELSAATFDLLHGYYRQAIGCLRNTLELVINGAYCQVTNNVKLFQEWRNGDIEIGFGKACDNLENAPSVGPLNRYLERKMNDSLFDRKDRKQPASKPGLARQLYSELSDYSHSRPGFTTVDLWGGSNGPIYVPKAFTLTFDLHLRVYALGYLLVKLGRPHFTLPVEALQLFKPNATGPMAVAYAAYSYLFAGQGQRESLES